MKIKRGKQTTSQTQKSESDELAMLVSVICLCWFRFFLALSIGPFDFSLRESATDRTYLFNT